MPPSTMKVDAVTKLDSSEPRNSTALAISRTSAKRPAGTCTSRRAAATGSLANSSWSNGVFVNGERVSAKDLAHGDVVQVGRHEMRFEAPVTRPIAA